MRTPATRRLPFQVTQPQPWSVANLRMSRYETLLRYGELLYFILLWTAADFEAGLVGRCQRCWIGNRDALAFGQPTRNKCPDCYGTGLEGGYRAIIIRPALLSNNNSTRVHGPRGEFVQDAFSMETTEDFLINEGDYIVRASNDRYQLMQGDEDAIRTGFNEPDEGDTIKGAVPRATLEDPDNSVAYIIPLPQPAAFLDTVLAGRHLLRDLRPYEVIRGPLEP